MLFWLVLSSFSYLKSNKVNFDKHVWEAWQDSHIFWQDSNIFCRTLFSSQNCSHNCCMLNFYFYFVKKMFIDLIILFIDCFSNNLVTYWSILDRFKTKKFDFLYFYNSLLSFGINLLNAYSIELIIIILESIKF